MILVIGAILLALNGVASPPLSDGWYRVDVDGYWFFMPPKECRVGPIPSYHVTYRDQFEMDMLYQDRAEHVFGYSTPPARPGDPWEVEEALDLPPAVVYGTLVHELAHVRGCDHPAVDALVGVAKRG